jgi:acyl dehydratase
MGLLRLGGLSSAAALSSRSATVGLLYSSKTPSRTSVTLLRYFPKRQELETLMSNTTTTMDGLAALVGTELGVSNWLDITQARVNTFADATDDHQWIHVNPERAAAGPFGAPIAHGYLTLSLIIPLFGQVLTVADSGMQVNYGLNKVRFPAPVPVGSKIRLRASLAACGPVANGLQLSLDFTVEVEGATKPACVAQGEFRFLR